MSLNFGEQINPHPSPLPSIQSQGVCLFVVFYWWLEQQHNIAWRGWGRESDNFPFFKLAKLRKTRRLQCDLGGLVERRQIPVWSGNWEHSACRSADSRTHKVPGKTLYCKVSQQEREHGSWSQLILSPIVFFFSCLLLAMGGSLIEFTFGKWCLAADCQSKSNHLMLRLEVKNDLLYIFSPARCLHIFFVTIFTDIRASLLNSL